MSAPGSNESQLEHLPTASMPRVSLFSLNDNYSRTRGVDQFFSEIVSMCEFAETLGFFGYFAAEHHFRESGTCPNPAVMLAHVAGRTKKLHVGSGVSVLSLRDPRQVAEDYMMVDILSGGRCLLGVGSGAFRFEFDGFGIDFETKRQRYEEALAIVRQAISGGDIQFQGSHFKAEGIRMNLPVASGRAEHMPLYVAGLSAQSAFNIGKAGDNLLNTPFISLSGGETIAPVLAAYRRGLVEGRGSVEGREAAILMHCHVARTDEEARARAQAPFETYIASRKDPQAPHKSYDEVAGTDVTLFGSVDQVAARILELVSVGVGHIILFKNFGAMPLEHVKASMDLFMGEVMPRVQSLLKQSERGGRGR